MRHQLQRGIPDLALCLFLLTACANGLPVGNATVTPERPESTSTTPPTISITPTKLPEPTPYMTATLPPEIEPLVGEGWGIYLVSPAGENLQRLTNIGEDYQHPQFSGDGTRIAFVKIGNEGQDSLMVYRRDTHQVEPLFEADGEIKDFAWSSDSSEIALAIQSDENVADLGLFDLETMALDEILTWDGTLSSVSWSYDGKYIAVAGSEPDTNFTPSPSRERPATEVYMFDVMNNQLVQLTSTNGFAFVPAWSPTEHALAYVEGEEEGIGGKLQLLHPFASDKTPVEIASIPFIVLPTPIWSPDGERIAYGADISASTVGAHGQSRSLLVFGTGAYFPTGWSPDGNIVLIAAGSCCLRYITLVDTRKIDVEHSNDLYEARRRLFGSKVEGGQFWRVGAQWSPVEDLIVFEGLWRPLIP